MASHIIFLHIPKAGGTTLRNVLYSQYARQKIFEIGEDVNGDIKRFKALPAADMGGIKLLSGHMSHGLHHFFPGSVKYLTMLRDPVKRVYSEFRFLSSNQLHPLYPMVSKLSFRQYLHINPTRQASNGQTRLLSGDCFNGQTGIPGTGSLGRGDFEKALKNLKAYYKTIGLLERFDETLLIWRGQLSWGLPFYEKKNITARASEPLNKADIALVKEINRYDLKLYEAATKQFDRTVQLQPGNFRQYLSLFQILNRLYKKLLVYRRLVRSALVKKRNTT